MTTKSCYKCEAVKNITDFNMRKQRNGTYSLHSYCRVCQLQYHATKKREARKKLKEEFDDDNQNVVADVTEQQSQEHQNPSSSLLMPSEPVEAEQIAEQVVEKPLTRKQIADMKRYEANKVAILERARLYRQTHKEAIEATRLAYVAKNKDRIRAQRRQYMKEYYSKNKEKYHAYFKQYRANNPEVKLRDTLARRIVESILKKKSTMDYLGTPILQVKLWLETNFEKNMSWKNHGTVWEIDHTLPIAMFDKKSDAHMMVCFNWMNLYPMYSADNRQKNSQVQLETINERKARLETFCQNNNKGEEYNQFISAYEEIIEWLQKN